MDHVLENEQEYYRLHVDSFRASNPTKHVAMPASFVNEDTRWQWRYQVAKAICTFRTSADILHFLDVQQQQNQNLHQFTRFPGNTLRLKFNIRKVPSWEAGRIEHNIFWGSHVLPLMRRCGKNLKSLSFHIHPNQEFTLAYFCALIRDVLSATPKLQVFKVFGNSFRNFPGADLTACFTDVPAMQNLQVLEFALSSSRRGSTIFYENVSLEFQQLITSPFVLHLKRLRLSFADRIYVIPLWQQQGMPNLEELTLTVCSIHQLESVLLGFLAPHMLRSLVLLLTAHWDHNPSWVSYDLGSVLRPVLKFRRTLEQLTIDAATESIFARASQQDVEMLREFTNLKYLYINCFVLDGLKIIPYIPRSVKYLFLRGSTRCRRGCERCAKYTAHFRTQLTKRLVVYHDPWTFGTMRISSDLPEFSTTTVVAQMKEIVPQVWPNLEWFNVFDAWNRASMLQWRCVYSKQGRCSVYWDKYEKNSN